MAKGLNTARDRCLADIDRIIAEKLETAQLSGCSLLVNKTVLSDYFHNAIHYTIGPEERQGLELFVKRYAASMR